MAILNVGQLSLEVRYEAFRYDWVYYNIWCRWRGKPMISEGMMRRDARKYEGAPEGAFVVSDYRECTLLAMLRTVLETNCSAKWGNQDFDIDIVAYAGTVLPYYNGEGGDPTRNIKWDPATDEDLITLLVLFESRFHLVGSEDDAESEGGPAFWYSPTRAEFTRFYRDLRAEYVEFSARERIEETNRAHYGSMYKEPWF